MRTIAIVTLSLLAVPALAADVYRSVDAQGNVVYTDRPTTEGSIRVAVRTSTPARAAQSTSEQTSPEPAADLPDQATIEAAERAQLAEDRAANCEIAKERNERYSTSRRLYRVGADGERVYLNDEQLTEARNEAEAEVSRWCD
ncbi:MAG: DUF4124 domain-containing protein [Gammaproteobacteria bacterium]|jgi:hypothetical protein